MLGVIAIRCTSGVCAAYYRASHGPVHTHAHAHTHTPQHTGRPDTLTQLQLQPQLQLPPVCRRLAQRSTCPRPCAGLRSRQCCRRLLLHPMAAPGPPTASHCGRRLGIDMPASSGAVRCPLDAMQVHNAIQSRLPVRDCRGSNARLAEGSPPLLLRPLYFAWAQSHASAALAAQLQQCHVLVSPPPATAVEQTKNKKAPHPGHAFRRNHSQTAASPQPTLPIRVSNCHVSRCTCMCMC